MTAPALTGTQKAAAVLLQLGKERAARVLAALDVDAIEELTVEILRMEHLEQTVADDVLEEFYAASKLGTGVGGGLGLAQELLEASLGQDRAATVLERIQLSMAGHSFEFLQQAEPHQVATLLEGEHPQTVALVLAHLRPGHASGILAGLPAEMQADVAQRIALTERAAPDVVAVVADWLQRKTSTVLGPRETTAVGGVRPLVEIINRTDPTTERQILEGLTARDEELAEQVRSLMLVFADIVLLDDRAVQLVLRQVQEEHLVLAVKGAADTVRDKILRNLSERARTRLLEDSEIRGAVPLSLVEEARAEIVKTIRHLEEDGQIVVRRDGEDEYVA